MDLIIVRHGLPERDDASHDPPLSDLGRKQAEATAEFLAGERVDHVVASTLRRAIETAEPLARRLDLEVETVHELCEVDMFEGAYIPAEQIGLDHPLIAKLVEDRLSVFEGVGGFDAFRGSIVTALDGLVARNKGRTVAVFCHGTVIGSYLTTLIGHDDPFMLVPDYCGLYRVKAAGNGFRTLRSANETGHVRNLMAS